MVGEKGRGGEREGKRKREERLGREGGGGEGEMERGSNG
jgi:hypothetical protein